MKKTITTTLLAILLTSTSNAQSNTFPSTGDVGIGTTDPKAKLHVNGLILFKDSRDDARYGVGRFDYSTYAVTGLFGNRIYPSAAVALGFYEGNTPHPALVARPSGNIGIGTSSPSSKFEVEGQADGNRLLYINETDGSPVGQVAKIFRYNNIAGGGDHTNALFTLSDHSTNVPLHVENHTGSPLFTVFGSGKVGIGTTSPSHPLSVNGTIQAKEVIVETGWADFVFEDTYRLRSLEEVEDHIEEHGHLPDVPSATVVESEGLSVGEAQRIMMQKIEELTLYVIEQDKKIEEQRLRILELESK